VVRERNFASSTSARHWRTCSRARSARLFRASTTARLTAGPTAGRGRPGLPGVGAAIQTCAQIGLVVAGGFNLGPDGERAQIGRIAPQRLPCARRLIQLPHFQKILGDPAGGCRVVLMSTTSRIVMDCFSSPAMVGN